MREWLTFKQEVSNWEITLRSMLSSGIGVLIGWWLL